jgi:TIM-barrel protein
MNFEPKVGKITFRNPFAISSIAGITDASFGNKFSNLVGAIFLGGFSIDERTIEASRRIALRGRKEFIFDDPIEKISEELRKARGYVPGVNVRASRKEELMLVSEICAKRGAILEINAHCRQKEVIEAGSGEILLRKQEILEDWIKSAKERGTTVSLKIRSGVVDEVSLAKRMERAGLDILHVDAMGSKGADLEAIRRIRNATHLFIIGNNSVRCFVDVKEMFGRGANMVSLARAILENPSVLSELNKSWKKHLAKLGWYNAPKHLCRGGDLRSLAFCCPPFRKCPLQRTLRDIGLSEKSYILLKKFFAERNGIKDDPFTCFGNIVWCCKNTKPCFMRDRALAEKGMSYKEYMEMKRELSEFILRGLRE